MSLEGLAPALLIGSAIVLVSILGVRLAGRLGVPGLLLYLVLGLGLGFAFPDIRVSDAELATVLGYSALALILAHGGLTTRASQLRPVLGPAIVLASLGVLVSIAVVALPLVLLAGLDVQLAVLLGAVLAATDAAAVFTVMRGLQVSPRLRSLLEAEAGFNDAPVVVLVSIVASGQFGTAPWWQVAGLIAAEIAGGVVVGIAAGFMAKWLLPRLALPAVGLYPIAALALLIGAYALADVLHVSGFMAVYLAGVLIGSARRLPHRRSIMGFADGLAWVAEIGLFVMLGLFADVSRLPQALGVAAIAGVTLVVLARPLSALLSLAPFRWAWQEIAFAGSAGLRGAVPIVFAAIPLGLGLTGSELVFDATLIIVLVLLLVQTPLLPLLARRLGLDTPTGVTELELESTPLDGMSALVLGVDVPQGSGLVGTFVSELGLPRGSVVSLIVRGGQAQAVDEHSRIRAGDQLLIVSTEEGRDATEERLRAVGRDGRLASWLRPRPPQPKANKRPTPSHPTRNPGSLNE